MISTASFSTLRGARWANVTVCLLMQISDKTVWPCQRNASGTHSEPTGEFPVVNFTLPARLDATARRAAPSINANLEDCGIHHGSTSAKCWAFDRRCPEACVAFGVWSEGLSN